MNFENLTAPTLHREPIVTVSARSLLLSALLAVGLTFALNAAVNRSVSPAQTQPTVPAHHEPGMHDLRAPQFIPIHTTVKEAKA